MSIVTSPIRKEMDQTRMWSIDSLNVEKEFLPDINDGSNISISLSSDPTGFSSNRYIFNQNYIHYIQLSQRKQFLSVCVPHSSFRSSGVGIAGGHRTSSGTGFMPSTSRHQASYFPVQIQPALCRSHEYGQVGVKTGIGGGSAAERLTLLRDRISSSWPRTGGLRIM